MLERIIHCFLGGCTNYVMGAVLSLSAIGCATYTPMNSYACRPAQQVPEALKQKMSVEQIDSCIRTQQEGDCGYDECTVSLVSRGKIVTRFESIESKMADDKSTWVVMYPILGGDDLLLVGYIARNVFAEQGINSAILLRKGKLVQHGGPYRPIKSTDPAVVGFEDYQYEAIKDTVRIVDYLKKNGMKEFGLVGFSLGGMQAVGAAGFVPESKVNIFVMAGGDISVMVMNSSERLVQEYKQHLVEQYGNEQDARIALAETSIDPLKFAKYIDTAKARMVVTTSDTAVPTICQLMLHYELGQPCSLFVPSNHYTLVWHYLEVRDFIVKELNAAFEFNKSD